MNFKLIKEKEI